jgi:hypothetical protein
VVVRIINDADLGISAVDAEQFSEVDLPFIGVTMTTERISNALPKAYRGVITINFRAHSGDALTVEEINEITNQLESLLATGFADALNDELDGIHIDYFAQNGGIPRWEGDSLECAFDCDVVFQTT